MRRLWDDLFARYPTISTQHQRTLRIVMGGLTVGLIGLGASLGFSVYGPHWAAWVALAIGLTGMFVGLFATLRDY